MLYERLAKRVLLSYTFFIQQFLNHVRISYTNAPNIFCDFLHNINYAYKCVLHKTLLKYLFEFHMKIQQMSFDRESLKNEQTCKKT